MIIFFRSLLFYILFYLWTFIIGFFSFPVFFLNRKYDVKVWYYWQFVTKILLEYIAKLKFKIEGINNLKKNKKAIYACQHQSAWDTIMLPYILGDCIIFHKKSLLFIPIFGWHLYKLGMIIIDRSKGTKNLKEILSITKKAILKKKACINLSSWYKDKI